MNVQVKYKKWLFKSCPHCGGDLRIQEEDRQYECLQCSRRVGIDVINRIRTKQDG